MDYNQVLGFARAVSNFIDNHSNCFSVHGNDVGCAQELRAEVYRTPKNFSKKLVKTYPEANYIFEIYSVSVEDNNQIWFYIPNYDVVISDYMMKSFS